MSLLDFVKRFPKKNYISLTNNPDFAEKLLGTLSVGPKTTPEEEKMCQRIWEECGKNRFEVLKKVVEICGNVDTPQARYVKAKAWTWNSTVYSKEAAEACEAYLDGDIYEDLNEIKNGFINNHLAKCHVAAGEAYANNCVKDYNKSDEHFKMALELCHGAWVYVKYAKVLRRTKRQVEATRLLEEAEFIVDNEWLRFRSLEQQLEMWNETISRCLTKERQYGDNTYKKQARS